MKNLILELVLAHPECSWSIRPADETERSSGGKGQQIDFVLRFNEDGSTRFFMSADEAAELVKEYVNR